MTGQDPSPVPPAAQLPAAARGVAGPWPALALGTIAAAVFVYLGAMYHPVATPGGEYDPYFKSAEAILQGHLDPDSYHPSGYPALAALLAKVTGMSCFAACKAISGLAAGVAIAVVGRNAVRYLGVVAGLCLALAMALHGTFFLHSLQACSDMACTAVVTLALALVFRPTAALQKRHLFGAAALLGAACTIRYNAVAGLGMFLPALLAGGWSRRGARAAMIALGFLAGFGPQAVVNSLRSVSDDNWRTIIWKYRFDFDAAVPASTPESPAWIIDNLWTWVPKGFADWGSYLARSQHELLVPTAGGVIAAGIGAVLGALILIALCRPARPGAATALLLLGFSWLLCMTLVASPRLTLPMVPAAFLLLVWALGHLAGGRRWRPWLVLPTVVLLAIGNAMAVQRTWREFSASHPLREIEAARELVKEYGRSRIVLTSYPPMLWDLGDLFVLIGQLPMHAERTPAACWQHLELDARRRAADFAILGRVTGGPFFAACASSEVPQCFEVLRRDQDVLVLRFRDHQGAGLSGFETEILGEELVLRLRAAPGTDAAAAGVLLVPAEGAEVRFTLRGDGPGLFVGRIPLRSIARGELLMTPFLLRANGNLERGAPRRLVVGGG